jgi:hypothetical protein
MNRRQPQGGSGRTGGESSWDTETTRKSSEGASGISSGLAATTRWRCGHGSRQVEAFGILVQRRDAPMRTCLQK